MSVNKIVTKVDGVINKELNFNDLKAGLADGAHTITVEAFNGATLVNSQTRNFTIAAAVSSYEAETTSYMNAIAIPDNTSASAYSGKTNRDIWVIMDDYFKGLKTNSLLVEGVFDFPMLGGTASTNGVDALNPTNSLIWFGSWIHSINGSTGNGSNTYAKTGVIPTDTTLTTTSGGIFVVSGTDNLTDNTDVFEFGCQVSNDTSLILTIKRSNAGNQGKGNNGKMYGSEPTSSSYHNALGVHSLNRKEADPQFWKDGVKQGVPFASGGSIPNLEIYIGTINLSDSPYSSGYSNQRLQGVILNNGLTDAQVVQWNDLINAREAALGRKTW